MRLLEHEAKALLRGYGISSPPIGVVRSKGQERSRLSEYVFQHRPMLPIVAFVPGQFADSMPGVRFGHARAIVEGDRGSTKGKIEKFHQAGIYVAEKFSDIVDLLKANIRKV